MADVKARLAINGVGVTMVLSLYQTSRQHKPVTSKA